MPDLYTSTFKSTVTTTGYNDLRELDTGYWPKPRVAVVFGASVFGNGDLSPILANRVDRAIELYQAGKVDRILVSGDNRHPSYNEPRAMQEYILSRGVNPSHVVVDNSGRSTYETCLRAKKVYGLDQAVLVTQNFHLARALYIANELGLDAVGMAANMSPSSQLDYQTLREWGAEVKAYFNLNFVPPEALLDRRKPIS
ncbi:MAG: YdcF family protein [Acidobacteria bacterium]|nr:YdcF family protein [Acidobacteriota bacterium]